MIQSRSPRSSRASRRACAGCCSAVPPCTDRRHARARPQRVDLADGSPDFVDSFFAERLAVEWLRVRQELVQDDPERVHVRSRIDIDTGHLRLFGTRVLGRTDQRAELGHERLVGQMMGDGLRDAEVDDFGNGSAVSNRNEDVRRLQIATDDAFLVW